MVSCSSEHSLLARITAYVVKVFSMAYSIIGIDEQQVCEPLIYLVTRKHELHTGNFVESNPVYSTTMTVRPQIHSNHEITFESIKT